MNLKFSTISVAAIALMAGSAGAAAAQAAFPEKPVRMIVSFAAGGPNDFIARVISQKLTEYWGLPVIVDNRPGAGGNIGSELAAKAPADGYTLTLVSTAFVVNPSLYKKTGYDPFRDFAPVTLAAVSPLIFVSHPSLPAKNMREVAQLAKKSPLNYASPGAGTTGHLGGELFNVMAGVKIQHIPYKGAAPATTDLLAGQVKFGLTALPPAVPHVKSGRLTGLAVTTAKRVSILPDVPTVSESGYPGYQVDNMYGILVAKGTPDTVIGKLHADIARALREPAVKGRLVEQGYEPLGISPDEFGRYLKSESIKWAKVVKESGARVD